MASGTKTYFEYRGVSNAVYAEVLSDTAAGITFGQVKNFTGVSEIGNPLCRQSSLYRRELPF